MKNKKEEIPASKNHYTKKKKKKEKGRNTFKELLYSSKTDITIAHTLSRFEYNIFGVF